MSGEGFRLEDGTKWIGGIVASSSNELEEVMFGLQEGSRWMRALRTLDHWCSMTMWMFH